MKLQNEYVEEEITLAEFSERFLNNNDFKTPAEYDLTTFDIQVETPSGFKPIKSFLVKEGVDKYYTDGKLKGTSNHRVFDGDDEIHLKDHSEFSCINEPMDVVDIEVDGEKYIANGRVNHNTTSGGKALAFHASLRLRLQAVGQIKDTKKNTIGIQTRCKIIKNRLGPPMRSCDFDLFFDRGLDNYGNWLNTLKDEKILAGSRTPYQYTRDNGEVISIDKNKFTTLMETDIELRNELYSKLCDIHIMEYKDQSTCASDDIEYDDSEDFE